MAKAQPVTNHAVQPENCCVVQPEATYDGDQHEPTKNNLRRKRQKERKKMGRVLNQDAPACHQVAQEGQPAASSSICVGGGSHIETACSAEGDEVDVVNLLRELAVQDVQAAWNTLVKEFSVQVLIWQSQASCKPSGEWVSVLEVPTRKEQMLRCDLERALKTNSLTAVQSALKRNSQHGGLLNKATLDACEKVLEADQLCELRWELALDLHSAHNCDCSQAEAENLSQRLNQCKVMKTSLQNQIRSFLGLSALDLPRKKTTNESSSEKQLLSHGLTKGTSAQSLNASDNNTPLQFGLFGLQVRIKNTFVEIDSDTESNSTASNSSRRSRSTPIQTSRT